MQDAKFRYHVRLRRSSTTAAHESHEVQLRGSEGAFISPRFTKALVRCVVSALLLAIGHSTSSYAQNIAWQNQIGHPSYYNGKAKYNDFTGNFAIFPNHFVAAVNGFVRENPVNPSNRNCYLQYYDYDGNLLKEDTIGGMISYGTVLKNTDSTFLLRTNYFYIRPNEIKYDTGQNGGYAMSLYSSLGTRKWIRSFRSNTKPCSNELYKSENGGFSIRSSVNMDGQGSDSLLFEFYVAEGFLERLALYPSGTRLSGSISRMGNPERYLSHRISLLGPTGPFFFTIAHLDSAMQQRRTDTIGVMGRSYGNAEIIPLANGGYISHLPQRNDGSDTLRARLFFFDGVQSRPTRAVLIDSGYIRLVPLADGGVLSTETKFVTNVNKEIADLYDKDKDYYGPKFFRRYSANWERKWSISVKDTNPDKDNSEYWPAAAVPNSPEDAIFYGSRYVLSDVKTEPWGAFALVGRINGVGRIFDPTALPGPRARPAPLEAILYPNPATDKLFIKTDKALSYRLIRVSGAVIKDGILQPNEFVDISALPPGMYLLRLQDGAASNVGRFVKN